MNRLAKGPKPDVLEQNEAEWTDEYRRFIAKEPVPKAWGRRYAHPDIKAAVKRETSDKCAYCDGTGTAFAPGDVEHIFPKTVFPDLVVEWTNLTFACTECNRRKSDYFSASTPLLNPYVDDPDEHLIFAGPWILHHAGAARGYSTRRLLELNRPDLVRRRADMIEEMQTLADRFATELDQDVRAFLLDQLREYGDPRHEFAATAREFLRQHGIS